ncbi:MAG: hypothetical protein M1275_00870 [Patescibacteria group bacterium]|nr:hypothetical protein [Patescibacteria group bacterium]
MFFSRQIGSRKVRKWFIVLGVTLTTFFGFEAIGFLAGIYQLSIFLNVSLMLYAFLIVMASVIFDLKLKLPKSWARSSYYYQHSKHRVRKILLTFGRALKLRFRYLKNWSHWLHFQNYLILPSVLYWGVTVLIFLNPFDDLRKQIFIICGTLMLAIVFWFLKTFFVSYSAVVLEERYLMFAIMVLAGFMSFTSVLGLVWYLGLPAWIFILGVEGLSFLLLYQSLFHHSLLAIGRNLKFALAGATFLGGVAYIVTDLWSVNYYSAGVLLAGCLHWYWSNVLQWLQGRLTKIRALEYTLIFLLVVLFVLATTNFKARIG